MSHITTIKTEIRDLDTLKSACTECGAVFVEGQTTYQWFGESVGDSGADSFGVSRMA
jgi:hypothetical protein